MFSESITFPAWWVLQAVEQEQARTVRITHLMFKDHQPLHCHSIQNCTLQVQIFLQFLKY